MHNLIIRVPNSSEIKLKVMQESKNRKFLKSGNFSVINLRVIFKNSSVNYFSRMFKFYQCAKI